MAIEIGLVLSCVFFIYRMSTLFQVQPAASDAQPAPPGVVLFNLYGALFFGAVTKVEGLAEKVPEGTHVMVLDLHRLVLMDSSGLDAMVQLQRSLARKSVRLMLCRVNEQPLSLLRRAGFDATLGDRNLHSDLQSALASAAAPGG